MREKAAAILLRKGFRLQEVHSWLGMASEEIPDDFGDVCSQE